MCGIHYIFFNIPLFFNQAIIALIDSDIYNGFLYIGITITTVIDDTADPNQMRIFWKFPGVIVGILKIVSETFLYKPFASLVWYQ